jgi:NADP-dependent 3-hydroxy acid dehydrogenase YdfG
MKGRGGQIINIGSISADTRGEDSSVYVATKAAIQAFNESLGKDVSKDGVKVMLIEPGAVDTDMQEGSRGEKLEKIERGEMLTADDIAACVEYCLVQPPRCNVLSVQIQPIRQPK